MSSLRFSNGSGGSTTIASWDPSGSFPQPSMRRRTTRVRKDQWKGQDSRKTVLDEPGAVQLLFRDSSWVITPEPAET